MRRGSVIGAAFLVLAGCGGGSAASGSGGGGGAGAPGAGGSAGMHGAGGAGANGGPSGGLPPCGGTTPPPGPVDPPGITAAGGFPHPRAPASNPLDPSGAWVLPEVFTWGDAGAVSDGGVPGAPTGGVVLDGDYDLVRVLYPNASTHTTRRTFRVFDGGTYIERAVLLQNPLADGGIT